MRTHIALALPLLLGLALASPERSTPDGFAVVRPQEGLWNAKSAEHQPNIPLNSTRSAGPALPSLRSTSSAEPTVLPTISKPPVLSPTPIPTASVTSGKGVFHNTAYQRAGAVSNDTAALPADTHQPGPMAASAHLMYWWHRNDGTPVYVPAAFYYGGLKVVPCESSWNQHAIGKLGEITWWQFLRDNYFYDRLAELGYTEEEIRTDPGKASELAVLYWRDRGWVPWWSCSKKAGLL